MVRVFRIALAGALVLTTAALAAPKGESFFPYPIKTSTLKNGLTVVRIPYASPGLLAYYTVVRVGSRNEVEKGHTGFAHFFEHVMFKGTDKYPEGSREKILGKLGFNENAFTSDDITVYHLYGQNAALEQIIDLESDRFANLKFSEQTFQTEAKAVLGEYHKSAAAPELRIEEDLLNTAFEKHTYKHTTLGFYDDIKAMPTRYEYSQQFFKRWYAPDNCFVVVVGDFDDAKLMALMEKYYGPWQAKVSKVEIPVEPPQRAQRQVHIDWPSPTLPRLIYAWHTPAARLDTQSAAVQTVLERYLVGTPSALYKDLVLDKQIVADLNSLWAERRDPYLFAIMADIKDPKDGDKVASAFDTAVRALVSGKVDAKKVESIKSHLRYQLLMSLETADDVAELVASAIGEYGTPDAVDRKMQNISKVQPKQLVEFAKEYFTANNRTILTLTSKPAAGGAR